MPSHYAEQEEQIYLKSRLHGLKIKKNEMTQRDVKGKIDEYTRSRYYQLSFWEQPGMPSFT